MYYNYPQQNQYYGNSFSQQSQQISTIGLKGRPVSSLDEARAAGIDFDGSLFIFPDIANKKIYTKQIGMDGSAVLNMYELKPIPTSSQVDYVTREEFNDAVSSIKQALEQEKNATQQESAQSFNF